MYNHAPQNYDCPFCLVAQNIEADQVLTTNADIVYQDEFISAFIGSHQWPNNQGHVIIIPNKHYENIYDLPDDYATKIHQIAKAVAIAMKQAYGCDGTSTRQHNEPAGNQEVWHYHLHVFPRYQGDNLYQTYRARMSDEEKATYAQKLRAHLVQ